MNIVVTGDFCPQHRVAQLFENGRYANVLGEVRSIVEQADYAIVNFECPVTLGGEQPIKKQGPNLQCTIRGLEAVKWAGFDCVTLANNHFRDFGDQGCTNTLKYAEANALNIVGGGICLGEAAKTLFTTIKDKTLAIINCCEHEFSIASDSVAGSNPLNPVQQYYAIREARQKADYVLVIVHGGHEHYQLPSPRMVETYRFFIDAGADAVVNHHQHCYSGYEFYNGKPIVYGLGNFCFDKNDGKYGKWNEGYMVNIHFDQLISIEIQPYCQCCEEPMVQILDSHAFDMRLQQLNETIVDSSKLKTAWLRYCEESVQIYSRIFEPLDNRYYLALKRRGWLPSLVSVKRRLLAADFICCEAHHDKLIHYLHQ